jgi:hypothetical protein
MRPINIHLPVEILDHILFNVTIDEPAFQWTTIRHLSSKYKHIVEKHFQDYWLHWLLITAYHGDHFEACSTQFDYEFTALIPGQDVVEFSLNVAKLNETKGRRPPYDARRVLPRLWLAYTSGFDLWKMSRKRVAHVRLGVGCPLLNRGFPGGHIVSDIELPGLFHKYDWKRKSSSILFDWKAAMSLIMREEVRMEKIRDEMLDRAIAKLKERGSWDGSTTVEKCRLLAPAVSLYIREYRREKVWVYRHQRMGFELPNYYGRSATEQGRISIEKHKAMVLSLLTTEPPKVSYSSRETNDCKAKWVVGERAWRINSSWHDDHDGTPPEEDEHHPSNWCLAFISQVTVHEEAAALMIPCWQHLSKEELYEIYAICYAYRFPTYYDLQEEKSASDFAIRYPDMESFFATPWRWKAEDTWPIFEEDDNEDSDDSYE